MGVPKDYTGKKYGMLTPIRRLEKSKNGYYIWLCKCDCGKEVKLLTEVRRMIKTVRCHYNKLADYCNKIGREHIISITSCFGEQYGEHFFTLVYDTPELELEDC